MSGPKEGLVILSKKMLFDLLKHGAIAEWKRISTENNLLEIDVNNCRSKAENLIKQISVPPEAGQTFRSGKDEQNQAIALRKKAEQLNKESNAIWNKGWKNNSEITAQNLAQQASDLIKQSNACANAAILAFDNVKILAEKKQEEDKQRELKRIAAKNAIRAIKNESENFNINFLSQWSGEPSQVENARLTLDLAEQKILNEQFDDSQTLANNSIVLFRKLYSQAVENKKRYENREIIADAIINALQSLRYDEPDVNYVQDAEKKFNVNNQLGDLAIFAKAKGESGDMKLQINLDGNVKIDVANIPDGKESECRQTLADLQMKIQDTTDFKITNWGRAENVNASTTTSELKNKSKSQTNTRERGR
ncbi:MAG: hypothetical protein LBB88_01040 [Planctomycetaceae bacterium]|jgi:hypothetical protein|nr:hypothetical protein [Planctomycetaceae bacterium]